MANTLDRIETSFRKLFEGTLGRIFGDDISPSQIAAQLAHAMSETVRDDGRGRRVAPDQFALTMHPEDARRILSEFPGVQAALSEGVRRAARREGFLLSREPHVALAADPTLGRWETRAVAWHSGSALDSTRPMSSRSVGNPDQPPGGAFLIVNGGGHFALQDPVVNIGRRLDNQLILDNPHVSRTHAQIRVRQGRYVIFDLGSTSGTKVNGHRISQHVLRAGDVISIAAIRLVYGEDPEVAQDTTAVYTPPFPPRPAGDHKTKRNVRDNHESPGT